MPEGHTQAPKLSCDLPGYSLLQQWFLTCDFRSFALFLKPYLLTTKPLHVFQGEK